jgi:hypothetical protein
LNKVNKTDILYGDVLCIFASLFGAIFYYKLQSFSKIDKVNLIDKSFYIFSYILAEIFLICILLPPQYAQLSLNPLNGFFGWLNFFETSKL